MIADTQTKLDGVRALTAALGEVRAERFIALIQREAFDYTKWQRKLWPERSVADISRAAMTLRRRK